MTDEPLGPRPATRRRRRLLSGLAAGGLAALGCAAWLAATGLAARGDLTQARAEVGRLHADLTAGRWAQADRDLVALRRRTAAARHATSGPVWAVAARIPWAGRPVRTVRGLAAGADTLAGQAMPALLEAARAVRSGAVLRSGDTVDLTALRSVSRPLAEAAARTGDVRRQLATLPAHTGLSWLDDARTTFAAQVGHLDGALRTAADAGRVLPGMLGADRPRRYFLALQTNAEARGTGGLVGAFAVLDADHGHLRFEPFAPDDGIPSTPAPVADFGPDFDHRYAPEESTRLLANSNLSPHFPYAARVWTGLWQARTGQHLDGAIATDPVGLADLLAVTGPVTLADGRRLTADNAVAFTERDMYAAYPDIPARKRALTRLAQSVADAFSHHRSNGGALLRALPAMASDGRLLVWSADRQEERQLAGTPLGGVLPDTTRPFTELVVNNAAAGKLDYYLRRRLDYRLGDCRDGLRSTTVHLRLTNTAPATGLPDYVTNRSDDPAHPHVRGSTLDWVSLYATHGAQLAGATVDGRPLLMSMDQERGHPVLSAFVEILPGQTRDLDVHLVEPAVGGTPLTPVQPLVLPQSTSVSAHRCPAG